MYINTALKIMVKLCLKCGNQGHTNKTCKNEVTSFGVIPFKYGGESNESSEVGSVSNNVFLKGRMYPFNQVNCCYHSHGAPPYPLNTESKPGELLFLLVERKDTIGFLNLVQGSYPDLEPYRGKKIIKYLNELTCEEREKLRLSSFKTLWEIAGSERRDYYKAESKWSRLNIGHLLLLYPCLYQEADYIMPKGRLKFGETVEDCAIREFCEETGYSESDISLVNMPPYEERFIGTDSKKYKNVFFVGKVKQNAKVSVHLGDDPNQTKEVRNMGWFNLQDCNQIMREYHYDKKKILEHASALLGSSSRRLPLEV